MEFGFADCDAAAFGAEDAAGDAAAVAEGVAEDEAGLAEDVGGEVGEGDEWEGCFAFDFDEGEVDVGVAGDVLGGVGFAVVGGDGDFHFGGAIDDVGVGEDVAGGVHEEAAAEALDFLFDDAGRSHLAPIVVFEKGVHGIAHLAVGDGFGVDVDDGGHGPGDGPDGGLLRGIVLRTERCEGGDQDEE